jgi:ribosomal-protein-serine acetyltransferase
MFTCKIDEKVSLKLVDLRDRDAIFQLTDSSREYLREWLPWVDFTTKPEDTEQFIKSSLKSFAENKSLTSVILYEGKAVGIAGFNKLDWQNKTAKIGYWLGEGYQGKGIMTKTVKALTSYAIKDLKMNKVEIWAGVENKKSRSIPERLGFVKEGVIRQAEWLNDRYTDHTVYGMLAEEWKED